MKLKNNDKCIDLAKYIDARKFPAAFYDGSIDETADEADYFYYKRLKAVRVA